MSSNIHEDPNVTLNVSYSRGVREDRGQRVDRQVDINGRADAFTDRHVQVSTQNRGQHTQKHLSAAQRKSLRTAALTGLLGVLLVVGVTVLSRLYISVIVENQQLSNRLEELQTSYQELQTSYQELQTSYQELQTSYQELQTSYQELQTSHDKNDCQFQGEESWKRFRCSCYYESTEKKNWTESRRECENRGADLVIINSKDEDDSVGELGKHGPSWIGLSAKTKKDWELKSEWKWVDGSAPAYLAWQKDVTITPEEGSVAYIDLQGAWDHTKEGLKHWICERPMN